MAHGSFTWNPTDGHLGCSNSSLQQTRSTPPVSPYPSGGISLLWGGYMALDLPASEGELLPFIVNGVGTSPLQDSHTNPHEQPISIFPRLSSPVASGSRQPLLFLTPLLPVVFHSPSLSFPSPLCPVPRLCPKMGLRPGIPHILLYLMG